MWRNGLITAALLLLLLCSLAVLAFCLLAGQRLGAALTSQHLEGFFWAAVLIALGLYSLLAVVCLGGVIGEAWHSRDIRRGRTWPVLIRMTTPKWVLLRPWVWFLTAAPLLLETLQTQAWREEARFAEKR
jgi:hypothetical protein